MVITIDNIWTTLAVLATVIGSITTIFGFIWKFFLKPKVIDEIKKTTQCNKMNDEISKKANKTDLEVLVKQVKENTDMIKDILDVNKSIIRSLERSVESDKHILQGIFACLDGLHQLNCNGKVTASLDDMRDFLIQREDVTITK